MWTNDAKNGEGVYHYVNKDIYDGFWIEDQRQGPGIYTYNDTGVSIAGRWEDGRLEGPVKIYFLGHAFEGRYNDGLLAGPGKYIFEKQGIEQTGKYIIHQMVQKNTDDYEEEEEFFEAMNKISVWVSTGMQPVIKKTSAASLSSKTSPGSEIGNSA